MIRDTLTWHEQQILKPTDTDAMIKDALQLAEEHVWYSNSGYGSSHRFNNTYYTQEEREADKNAKNNYIRVDRFTNAGTYRFQLAMSTIRLSKAL